MDSEIPIRSVSRFIAVFREINLKGPLSLGEMVQATGIPYPTTSRIVQTMLSHGLIEQIPKTKSYSVAAMAMSLSHGFQAANRLATAARPVIEALTHRIGWPVAVMTRVGTSMVARASTHHLTSLSFHAFPAGSSIPVLHSASGHVFLAYASREERAGVLDGLQRFNNISPMLSLFQEGRPLERIRAEGHATYERNMHSQTPGKTSSISVPVQVDDQLQGTLTMIFFASAMPMDEALRRYLAELRQSAKAIELSLALEFAASSPAGRSRARAPAAARRLTTPLPAAALSARTRDFSTGFAEVPRSVALR